MAMFDRSSVFIKQQQPRGISFLKRRLRDQFLRKIKIEIGLFHSNVFSVRIISCFAIIAKPFRFFNRDRS